MSLLTYDDARPHAKAIRDEVGDGNMPPWHADPKHGKFANDRSLSASDRETLLRWANNGAPQGDPKDLPAAPRFVDGWMIGEPDLVLTIPEYKVPAEGFVEYEYIELATNLAGGPVDPGARGPARQPRGRAPRDRQRAAPAAGAAADGIHVRRGDGRPGRSDRWARRARRVARSGRAASAAFRDRSAGRLDWRFRSRLVDDERSSQERRCSCGKDRRSSCRCTTRRTARKPWTAPKIGLFFAKQAPTEEVRFANLSNGSFTIPAGASDHVVTAEMVTTADVTLRQMLPHTHLRGKSWEYTATYPDGRSEVLLAVPKYDFNWQTDYVFATPVKLPKGTKIRAVAHYDNSAANKANPDPTVDVKWGDQTWEEMMFTAFVYSLDGVAPGTVLPHAASRKSIA